MHAIILGSGPDLQPWSLSSEPPATLENWQRNVFAEAGINTLTVLSSSTGRNRLGMMLQASTLLDTEPCLVAYGELAIQSSLLRAMASGMDPIEIAVEPCSTGTRTPTTDAFRILYNDHAQLTGVLTTAREIRRSPIHGSGRLLGLWRITPSGWKRIRRIISSLTPEERHRMDIPGLLSRLVRAQERIRLIPVYGGCREVIAPEQVDLGDRVVPMPHCISSTLPLRRAV